MHVKHSFTETDFRTEIFIQLKQFNNANYSGIDNDIENLNGND